MAQADDKLVGNLEQQAVCSTSRRCCGNFTKFEMCLIGVSLALLAGLLGTLACWIVITKGFQKFVPGILYNCKTWSITVFHIRL